MKKEAKGKSEGQKETTGRRIPIGVFSTQRWPVWMKTPAFEWRDTAGASPFVTRVSLCSRELDLGALLTGEQKLAA